MNYVEIILIIMLIILVILIGMFLYITHRMTIIMGGIDENESDESFAERVKIVYQNMQKLATMVKTKSYTQLGDDEKKFAANAILKIINGATGLNIVMDKSGGVDDIDNNNAISLEWLVKSGMWKILMMQTIIGISNMATKSLIKIKNSKDSFISAMQNLIPYYENGEDKTSGGFILAAFALVVAGTLTALLFVGIFSIIIVEMAMVGILAVSGIAATGATAISLIAAIYSIFNMYFNYQLRRDMIQKIGSDDAALKSGITLATQDVSNSEMREFMKFSIGGSSDIIKSVSIHGLDILSDTAKTALNAIGNTGSATVNSIALVGSVVPATTGAFEWPNLKTEIGSYIEAGMAIQEHIIHYDQKAVYAVVDSLYNIDEVMEVFLKSRANPACEILQNIALGMIAIYYKLCNEI